MIRRLRYVLVLVAGSMGLVVATAAPAYAGLNLSNHTEPLTRSF